MSLSSAVSDSHIPSTLEDALVRIDDVKKEAVTFYSELTRQRQTATTSLEGLKNHLNSGTIPDSMRIKFKQDHFGGRGGDANAAPAPAPPLPSSNSSLLPQPSAASLVMVEQIEEGGDPPQKQFHALLKKTEKEILELVIKERRLHLTSLNQALVSESWLTKFVEKAKLRLQQYANLIIPALTLNTNCTTFPMEEALNLFRSRAKQEALTSVRTFAASEIEAKEQRERSTAAELIAKEKVVRNPEKAMHAEIRTQVQKEVRMQSNKRNEEGRQRKRSRPSSPSSPPPSSSPRRPNKQHRSSQAGVNPARPPHRASHQRAGEERQAHRPTKKSRPNSPPHPAQPVKEKGRREGEESSTQARKKKVILLRPKNAQGREVAQRANAAQQ